MFVTPAFAQAAGAASQTSSTASTMLFFAQIALLIGAFYFLVMRPQQRRQKDHKAAIDAVKKGDSVVTGGGLVGKVTKVDDQHVELELGPNVKVRAVKSTLAEVMPLGGAKPAND